MKLKRVHLRVRITQETATKIRELSDATGLDISDISRLAIDAGLPRTAQILHEITAPYSPSAARKPNTNASRRTAKT